MGRTKQTSGQRQSKTKAAIRAFNDWYPTRPDKTEEYRRCKTVPYWFVSNKGNVKSFENPSNPKDIIQHNNGKYKYVSTHKPRVPSTQYVHRLMAEVGFHVPTFGKAKNRRTLKGLEVHHTEADKRNEADALQILTPEAHELLNHIPTNSSPEKEIKYLKKISSTVSNESPDQAVVITSGKGILVDPDTGIETPIDGLTQRFFTVDDPGFQNLIDQVCSQLRHTLKIGIMEKKDIDKLNILMKDLEKRKKFKNFISVTIQHYPDLQSFETEFEGIKLIIQL